MNSLFSYENKFMQVLMTLGDLIILNLLHPLTGMLFELNVLTCAIVGTLGLPGVAALVIAHYVLGG